MADAAAVRVFISYSSRDKKSFDKLLSHLQVLLREGLIDDYHDQQLRGGDDWTALLDQYLDAASLVLLLVSADYLRSVSTTREMERALAHVRAGKQRVIPIILEPCAWQKTPLASLMALPTGARPVSDWENPDEAFLDVVMGIRVAVDAMHTGTPASPPPGKRTAAPPPAPRTRARHLADYRFSSESARVIAAAGKVQPSHQSITTEALLYAVLRHGDGSEKTSGFFTTVIKSIAPIPNRYGFVDPVFPTRVDNLEPRELTHKATTLMELALRAALATTGGRVISLRHLVFGLIQPTGAVKDDVLKQLGVDVASLTGQYLAYLRKYLPLPDEIPAWERLVRRAVTENAMSAYRPAYAADHAAGTTDRLGFTKDARALAALIASSETRPPLSIGLFGDWGSGKSFFMRQMREMVADTADRAAAAAAAHRPTAYYGKIVQIEFNAWHYIEGNLWASLVEHIFSNLRLRPDAERDEVELEKQRAELMKLLEIEEQQATTAKAARDEAWKAAAKARYQRKQKIEKRVRLELVKTDWTTAFSRKDLNRLGVDTATIANLGKLYQEGKRLRLLAARIRTTWELLAKDRGESFTFALSLLVPAAIAVLPAIVWWFADRIDLQAITKMAGAVAAGCAIIATALRRWIGEANRVVDAVTTKHRELQLRRQQEAIAIDQEIAALSRDAEEAELKALQVTQRIEDIRKEMDALSSATLFSRFIEERASSADYRRHLGVLANIRRDFERMARLLESQRTDTTKPAFIERIVLYIDDLDRCPAGRVVQVLQAIHLLLAFPIFVVVVGVDARWIARALQSEYDTLLGIADDALGREATAHDYLQKIFQVPFWIRPMNDDTCKELIASLTDTRSRAGVVEPQPATVVTSDAAAADAAGEETLPQAAAAANVAGSEASTTPTAAEPERDEDLNPLALHVLESEVEFMSRLTPLMGRSPRAVKRFINCYQLLKIALEPYEIGPFLTDPDAGLYYKPVMFLLAVVTGTPEFGDELLDVVDQPAIDAVADVDALILTWPDTFGEAFIRERELVAAALAAEAKLDREAWHSAGLQNAARVVRRYSFRAGYAVLRGEKSREKEKASVRGKVATPGPAVTP